MFVVKFSKSCLVTYMGVVFGLISMYFAFSKETLFEVNSLNVSLACLMISGVCDMFDGKFARGCKRTKLEKEMGIQMDSLADTICFLAVPVVIMLSLKMYHPICLITYIYFLVSGITRLAYFNVSAEVDKVVDHYNGLPVTTTAIIYPLICFITTFIKQPNVNLIFLTFTTFIVGLLFNLKIKIPKLKTALSVIVALLAIAALIVLFVF